MNQQRRMKREEWFILLQNGMRVKNTKRNFQVLDISSQKSGVACSHSKENSGDLLFSSDKICLKDGLNYFFIPHYLFNQQEN